jgi:hypothetical protein
LVFLKYQSLIIQICIMTSFYSGKKSMVSYCDMTPERWNSGARAEVHC